MSTGFVSWYCTPTKVKMVVLHHMPLIAMSRDLLEKIDLGLAEMDQQIETLAMQAWQPEFDPQTLHKKQNKQTKSDVVVSHLKILGR